MIETQSVKIITKAAEHKIHGSDLGNRFLLTPSGR